MFKEILSQVKSNLQAADYEVIEKAIDNTEKRILAATKNSLAKCSQGG